MGSARINVKEREVRRVKKRKGIEAQNVKHPTSSRAIDALIGDEDQNGKHGNKKKDLEIIRWTYSKNPLSTGGVIINFIKFNPIFNK